jgi:integrase
MRRVPRYCIHKARNLAYVTIGGREHYLGRAHSPESHAAYHEIVGALRAGESIPSRRIPKPSAITVAEVAEQWFLSVLEQNGKRHQMTREARYATSAMIKEHAKARACDFGPKAFKAIRDRLVRAGRSRQWVNRLMNAIRRCFRWAVGEELVTSDRLEALRAVDGLRYGLAPEAPPRTAADPDAVEAVLGWLDANQQPGAAAIIRFLRATGCRPGEACHARWQEFTLTGEKPRFEPAKHKTARLGIERMVPLNTDALAAVQSQMRVGNSDGSVFLNTKGKPFRPNSILLAIRRAIAATGCAGWHTYGLRHLAATKALALTGSEESAAALLGHSPRSTIIRRYSRDRFTLATKAAKAIEIQEVA